MTSNVQSAVRTELAIRSPRTAGLTLSVLDGIHRGVTAAIEGGSCTIGAASDRDVVLADEDVAPDHLRLRFYGRQVAVDAVGGDARVEGLPVIRKGHGCRATLPIVVSLGAARIRLGRDVRQAGRLQHWLPVGAVALVLVIGGVLVANQSSGYGAANKTTEASGNEMSRQGVIPADGSVAEALRQHLADAGLDDLAVTESDRHLSVSGTVSEDGLATWTDVQRWFDGSYGGHYVLSSRVTTAAPAGVPEFSFQAVWFGTRPYVIDAQGQRRYPGAALQGGWVLKSIDPDGITVSRNGTDFLLKT